jgi:hypothetical protein
MFKLIEKTKLDIPILTIDTGFWFNETYVYMGYLAEKYKLNIYVYGPSPEQIEEIKRTKLWEKDIKKYHEIVKLKPLKNAVEDLKIEALLSGVRADQILYWAGIKRRSINISMMRKLPDIHYTKRVMSLLVTKQPQNPAKVEQEEKL